MLSRATPLIGHFQIRNRGTVGGSLAHADPASEYPAVAVALGAELEVSSKAGPRTVAADDFFVGTWTTALADGELLTAVRVPVWSGRCGFAVEEMARPFRARGVDAIAAAEARGFLFAAPLALELHKPLVPLRKPGKLPYRTHSYAYDLEYGSAELHVHIDAITPGARVLLIDDLLATGGTMQASCQLVEKAGGQVAGCAFLVELGFLHGRLTDRWPSDSNDTPRLSGHTLEARGVSRRGPGPGPGLRAPAPGPGPTHRGPPAVVTA